MIGVASVMAMMRGLHLAAMLSLLGTVGFLAWMLPGGSVELLRRRLVRLWWVSGVIALLAGAGWFALQAAAIADAGRVADVVGALPVVAWHTRYGNILMVRLGLLVGATVLAVRPGVWGRYLALCLAVAALGLQGLIGHAGAAGGAVGDGLVASESLHLLAAGIWLGALLPLWFSLRVLPPVQAAAVCERFSPIGLACVLVLAGTGFAQGLALIGGLPALLGTPYGHVALLKIVLFLVALALAALNRLWLTDRVAAGRAGARSELAVSICVEVCLGLAIVTAAAFMASSQPAAHTTPVWPLSWQFSLVTVDEDPDFRREVVVSLAAIGVAAAVMVAALLWRRFRLVALAILVLVLVWRGPSLSLLTVEAYPTSFQVSPTGFSAASIVRGRELFARTCVACHGAAGRGDGPAAGLRIKPADLTAPHVWEHTDGEMFWWLTHGVDDPEGGLAMPGFASLSADDRWALIDYVRAHNAALALQEDAAFNVPAPAFPIACAGVTASRMEDLRGRVVLVVAGEGRPPSPGVVVVSLGRAPVPGACVAADPAAWQAFAILADLPADALSGAAFLIDANGWLRAVHRPGSAGGWLATAIRDIDARPIQQLSGGQHEHHH
jgi:putative copper export protein/mono/diheme cytochrome c family protein